MRGRLAEIRRRGAELVVVGNGQPMHAADFRDQHGLDFPLYVDPELEAYAAAGLRRGLGSTLRLGVLRSGLRALREGHRQGRTRGDPWQQGGVFVITPAGDVLYEYISQEAGDHPDPDQVLAHLPTGTAAA